MTDKPLSPEECRTMSDVRVGVNATDAALVELLARRFGYMRAAARIKHTRDDVRDERRKAQVIAAVRDAAVAAGIPADAIAELWDGLVEASIAYELEEWDRSKG